VVLIGKPTYYCFYKPGSTCKAATPSTAAEVLIWAFPLPFYALLIIGLVAKAQIHMGFTDLENEADSTLALQLLRVSGNSDLPVWFEAGAAKFEFANTTALFFVQLLLMG